MSHKNENRVNITLFTIFMSLFYCSRGEYTTSPNEHEIFTHVNSVVDVQNIQSTTVASHFLTFEQINSYFSSENKIIVAMCDCFAKNNNFNTTKEECIENMGILPGYKECGSNIFKHMITEVDVKEVKTYLECTTKSANEIAIYFENECVNINDGNYNETLKYINGFDNCEIEVGLTLRLSACDKLN